MRKYSYQGNTKKTARAYGKEINVSWKACNEVCYAVKGMFVDKALVYLNKVQKKEDFIPYRRYKRHKAHRKGGKPGGYPIKAAGVVSDILKSAKANAEQKGLNTERLKVVHATAYKALTLERIKPKGRGGRGMPFSVGMAHNIELADVEIVVREV